jgi:hypothetical protein
LITSPTNSSTLSQTEKPIEFKPLFAKVFEALKLKNAVSGGEEMLRLRSYEKIIKLTSCGLVREDRQNVPCARRHRNRLQRPSSWPVWTPWFSRSSKQGSAQPRLLRHGFLRLNITSQLWQEWLPHKDSNLE